MAPAAEPASTPLPNNYEPLDRLRLQLRVDEQEIHVHLPQGDQRKDGLRLLVRTVPGVRPKRLCG